MRNAIICESFQIPKGQITNLETSISILILYKDGVFVGRSKDCSTLSSTQIKKNQVKKSNQVSFVVIDF